MEKVKTKSLTLKFPADKFKGIIDSYADKTGWTPKVNLPKKQGKIKQKDNPLTPEGHVAKILQDRLISLHK